MIHPDRENTYSRWPRSFRLRQGKATEAQKQALRDHWQVFGIDCPGDLKLDLEAAFGRSAYTVLEIGFGMGESLLAEAEAHPEWNFVGIEVHKPGVGAVVKQAADKGLKNLRIIRSDVLRFLTDNLAKPSFHEVRIFFPEPWPRGKNTDHRLVRPMLIDLLDKVMIRPGKLILSTDIEDYVDHMSRVIAKGSCASWRVKGGLVGRPDWRPVTKYEKKACAAGRKIFDLSYSVNVAE